MSATEIVTKPEFTTECEDLYEYFEVLLAKAVGKCAVRSLESLAFLFRHVG